jgi:hypothetical protein
MIVTADVTEDHLPSAQTDANCEVDVVCDADLVGIFACCVQQVQRGGHGACRIVVVRKRCAEHHP